MARLIKESVRREIIANGIDKVIRQASPRKAHAILFGSRARGDARKDSDWDVLILLDKDRVTPADIDEISYPIRELGWQIDEMINPIMFTTKEWEAKSFTPFYKNVMKEGVAL
jgi:predicted nucleotidyltransferase